MDTLRRIAPWAVVLLAGLTCTFKVDPDKGRFSCAEERDCRQGFECRPQVAGGGLCYRQGECGAESCDGLDNDCDGVADNNVCAAGAACRDTACVEVDCADGLDNDSSGQADCDDPSCAGQRCADGGAFNCGRALQDGGALDAGEPDAGEPARACVPPEALCDDGLDDDGDGPADCADGDCDGRSCADGGTCAQAACR